MSMQKMQPNTGMRGSSGRPDTFTAEQGHLYASSQAEGQWAWVKNAPHLIPSHPYVEVQGNTAQSLPGGRLLHPKVDLEIHYRDPRSQSQSLEQDMEIGYEDQPSPVTFEGLERRFQEEIMKLINEQNHMEDAENARHKERMMEINNQYQEKLAALRGQQANQREEFLQKESQARLVQYQQAETGHHPIRAGTGNSCGHGMAVASLESEQAHVVGQLDPYKERSAFIVDGRSQGTEVRYQLAGISHHPTRPATDEPHGHSTAVAPLEAKRAHVAGQINPYREPTPFIVGGRSRGTEVQYQQAGIGHHPTRTATDAAHVHSTADVPLEGDRAHVAGQLDPYRGRTPFLVGERNQGTEARVPYPAGRFYNNSNARLY